MCIHICTQTHTTILCVLCNFVLILDVMAWLSKTGSKTSIMPLKSVVKL